MKTWTMVLILSGTAAAESAVDLTPGSYFNPLVATPRIGGGYEVAPRLPSFEKGTDNFAPGGYNNPIVVKPVSPGSDAVQIAPRYPFLGMD